MYSARIIYAVTYVKLRIINSKQGLRLPGKAGGIMGDKGSPVKSWYFIDWYRVVKVQRVVVIGCTAQL